MEEVDFKILAYFDNDTDVFLDRFDLDSRPTVMLESIATSSGMSISVERPLNATVSRGAASDGLTP